MALDINRQQQRQQQQLRQLSRQQPAKAPPGAVQDYLNDRRSFYSCIYCRTHLADHDQLVSRSFQGNRSRAYLFNAVVNISCGSPVQRELNTGSHAVADVHCMNCSAIVGWKYEKAYEMSQKYKEGKYIIELAHVVRENRHLELDKRDMYLSLLGLSQQQQQQQHQHQHQHQHQAPLASSSSPRSSVATGQSPPGGCRATGGRSPQSPTGLWSSIASSLSSSGSSSSSAASSPNSTDGGRQSSQTSARPATATPGIRFRPNQLYSDEDDETEQDLEHGIDHEEMLMFQFYDDLHSNTNRASYSSAPSDWHADCCPRRSRCRLLQASQRQHKQARGSRIGSQASSTCSTGSPRSPSETSSAPSPSASSASPDAGPSACEHKPPLESSTLGVGRPEELSSLSLGNDDHPLTGATSECSSAASTTDGCSRATLAARNQQSTSVASAVTLEENCDPSTRASQAPPGSIAIDSRGPEVASQVLSLDDEEFYDCVAE